ncbi:hypothetical protein Pmani_030960 [Petrolisthes manimaculis]|uniref:beta-N-acetylhexosaminidase n=1 Tax=Petrolisthes manimaculis TaxID=1843537 RepID=A0AAE1TSZ7_9EUCA|nr:hypothetical protein Pmani_030960 [Petrolisthes manimaculis]
MSELMDGSDRVVEGVSVLVCVEITSPTQPHPTSAMLSFFRRRRLCVGMGVVMCMVVGMVVWGVRSFPRMTSAVFVVTPRRSQPRVQEELTTQPGTEAPPERLWHLDLKGGAPKVAVVESLMALAARAGATGVLIEWEDMFPYTGPLANISAHNAYSMVEVKRIVAAANSAGLQLIHLMQSLGHLEYILKLPQWSELREGEGPGEACPSNPHTSLLIMQALEQLMAVAPATHVHIGADEVYTLGKCQRCRARELPPLQLYVDYLVMVAKKVRERWDVRVLVWDDMLRHAPAHTLRSLATLIEPVVWAYGPDVTKLVPPYILRSYATMFPRVWLAPAFKGANGPRSIMPDAGRHAANTLAWVEVGQRLKQYSGLGVAGMVITGWSRYDHFAVLCELLPPSTPSLVLTLLVASRGFLTSAVLHDTHALLECPPHVIVQPSRDPLLWSTRDCSFPGANVATFLHRYARLRRDVRLLRREVDEVSGWLTPYNVRHNFSSPSRVREGTGELASLTAALRDVEDEAEAVLAQYLNPSTVIEWREQHLTPLNLTLTSLTNITHALLARTTWPRRPLEWQPPFHTIPPPPPPPPPA